LDGMGGRMAHAWGTLLEAVRTGRPAYHEVFGRPFWDDLAEHPEIAAKFDEMMGPAGQGTPDPEGLVSGGGGTGGLGGVVGGGGGRAAGGNLAGTAERARHSG